MNLDPKKMVNLCIMQYCTMLILLTDKLLFKIRL